MDSITRTVRRRRADRLQDRLQLAERLLLLATGLALGSGLTTAAWFLSLV